MIKDKIFSYLMSKVNVSALDELMAKNWLTNIPRKFFIQRMISYDFPQHLFLETTSACNLKCQLCPRTHGETLVGHMDFELFKKIVDESNEYGPRNFCLHLFGEPLLAPKFIDEIYYIKKVNPRNSIVLTSNGTMLNEEIAQAAIKAPIDKLTISFMSTDKINYPKITGVDKLEEIEENVKRLASLKKQSRSLKPKIFVRLILNERNVNEQEKFKRKWKNQGVIVEIRPAHNYGGNVKDNPLRKIPQQRYPCYHLWLSPAIHWNGDFSICCNDYNRVVVFGNVKNQTINELWQAPKLKEYRKLMLEGKYDQIPLCNKCNVWSVYNDIFFNWQKK